MQARGRRLRFTAVAAMVVLALTGFSRGHGHTRHGSGSGGSGGGCSSSSQDHDGSSSTSGGSSGSDAYDNSYDDSDDSSSSGSGGTYTRRPHYRSTSTPSGSGDGEEPRDATAKLVSCASGKAPYATVEVTNPNDSKGTFSVDVTFKDAQDEEVDHDYKDVKVPAKGKATVRVPVDDFYIDRVDHCEVDPTAAVD